MGDDAPTPAASASERVALPDGGHVAVEVTGDSRAGTPALLLRPLGGSTAMWGAFRDALGRRMTVVAFDPRGVGGSSDAPAGASTRDMARDAVAVLDALGVDVAHVFGISLGAMVATWLAIDAPERVARLCLASAGPVGFALSASGLGRGVAMATTLLAPDDEVVGRLAEAVLSRGVRERDGGPVAAVEAAAEGEPARRVEVVKLALAAARHDARDALPRVAAPTLVLAGDRDELIGSEPPAALAAAIEGARLEVIADAGHDVTLERPAAAARAVGVPAPDAARAPLPGAPPSLDFDHHPLLAIWEVTQACDLACQHCRACATPDRDAASSAPRRASACSTPSTRWGRPWWCSPAATPRSAPTSPPSWPTAPRSAS
jgi:3-oxoadipate enol-lactonase